MGPLLILLASCQEQSTIDKGFKVPYQEAVRSWKEATAKLESDPEKAIQLLTGILDNPKIQKRECRLRIEVASGIYEPEAGKWYDFFPYQLRGRARMSLAERKERETSLRLLGEASVDFEESLRRGVSSSQEYLQQAKLKRESQAKVDPPQPTAEKIWRERFERIRNRLAYLNFQTRQEETVREARELCAAPEAPLREIEEWIEPQIAALPRGDWPKRVWVEKGPDARRILAWCAMTAEFLPKRCEKLHGALLDVETRLGPVARYRGTITLKIHILPYARLHSFRVGETWLVREGKGLPNADLGDNLYTPVIIRDLDIAVYTLVLVDAAEREHSLEIQADSLENGKTYLYFGSLDPPNSFRIRSLP